MKKKLRMNVEEIRVDQFVVVADGGPNRGTVRGFCGDGLSDSCSGTQSDSVGASAPCRYCFPMPDTYSCHLGC